MTFTKAVEVLGGAIVAGKVDDTRNVGRVVANDLMSDVLLSDDEDVLMLTSLASDQTIRTAQIIGALGVVVHNAKPLPVSMKQAADAAGIPLASCPLPKYESCVALHDALEAEKNA